MSMGDVVKQTIEPLNEDEIAWVAENLEIAKKIVGAYTFGAQATLEPQSLDKAFLGWSENDQGKTVEANKLVNALGIAFGQYLVDRLGMRWAVVSDETGTDLAVHGSPGDILIFPTSAVAKRIANYEGPFFEELGRRMATDVERIRRQTH
jgi:hypothetical protein